MGLEQSKPEAIQQNWTQSNEYLKHIHGKPMLVTSIRHAHLIAEQYTLEVDNTNLNEEIAIYKQRRINHQNIVGLYDFQVTKAFLGCARNLSTYNVVTERIAFRLSDFQGLSSQEAIFIFHEALNGYNQLSKYKRVCYPLADMIGIKQNAEVKVWTNSDWSQNGYRHCHSVSSSIETLWTTIKLHCGDSRTLGAVNDEVSTLKGYEFQKLISLLRFRFSRDIVEGRFKLERRIKDKNLTATSQASQQSRPRANSQQLRRPPPEPISNQNYQQQRRRPQTPVPVPSFILNRKNQRVANEKITQFHQVNIQPHPQQRQVTFLQKSQVYQPEMSQVQKVQQPQRQRNIVRERSINRTPEIQNNQMTLRPVQQNFYAQYPMKSSWAHRPAEKSQSPYRTNQSLIQNYQLPLHPQRVNFMSSASPSTGSHSRQKMQKSIHFHYQKVPDPDSNHKNPQYNSLTIWRNQLDNQKQSLSNSQDRVTTHRNIHNPANNSNNKKNVILEKTAYKICNQPTVQPFQLQLKLENIIARQGFESRRDTIETERYYRSTLDRNIYKEEGSPIYDIHDSRAGQMNTEEDIKGTPRRTYAEDSVQKSWSQRYSQPKQAAEQFKYYLRQSLQKSQEHSQSGSINDISQGLRSPAADDGNNSHCIIERWEEEESFTT